MDMVEKKIRERNLRAMADKIAADNQAQEEDLLDIDLSDLELEDGPTDEALKLIEEEDNPKKGKAKKDKPAAKAAPKKDKQAKPAAKTTKAKNTKAKAQPKEEVKSAPQDATILTTKEVAAMVGTTPKELRRVLRAQWYNDGKMTYYRWTKDDPILKEILDYYKARKAR